MDKDERHHAKVSSYCCLFYPFAVKSYGVWDVHSLEVLRSIAKKSLLSSGFFLSQASRQSHEELSVCLWQYYPRIIYDRLDLVIVNYLPNYYDVASLCFRP